MRLLSTCGGRDQTNKPNNRSHPLAKMATSRNKEPVRAWRNGSRNGLIDFECLSGNAESRTAQIRGTLSVVISVPIPSQALEREGVETRRVAPTAKALVKG